VPRWGVAQRRRRRRCGLRGACRRSAFGRAGGSRWGNGRCWRCPGRRGLRWGGLRSWAGVPWLCASSCCGGAVPSPAAAPAALAAAAVAAAAFRWRWWRRRPRGGGSRSPAAVVAAACLRPRRRRWRRSWRGLCGGGFRGGGGGGGRVCGGVGGGGSALGLSVVASLAVSRFCLPVRRLVHLGLLRAPGVRCRMGVGGAALTVVGPPARTPQAG
jgi:hypothetical protein